ncbi:hypothetical protein [Oscillibacter sp. 1-3]|uniref:hypothetical protein n=1 Tax=Oscillibacter sp. 1-3 TaxID=1235797 RepID=UPI0003A6A39F|nr:hypothetical protein [Oscillibacter sp. 1-3]
MAIFKIAGTGLPRAAASRAAHLPGILMAAMESEPWALDDMLGGRGTRSVGILITSIWSCLKKVKTPKRRIFFRRFALIFLAIHKVCQRQIALIGKKISRRCAFCHLSNKAWRSHHYNGNKREIQHLFSQMKFGRKPPGWYITGRAAFYSDTESAPQDSPLLMVSDSNWKARRRFAPRPSADKMVIAPMQNRYLTQKE